MTLSIVQKQIKFGDGTSGQASFATDGTNVWPVSVLANESGALITDSTGLPVAVTTGSPGGALANASFTKNTDGVNVATVKAASTAAASADQALVVAVSPNTAVSLKAAASAALDGWNVTEGTTTDAAWPGTGPGTINAVLKALVAAVQAPTTVSPLATAPNSRSGFLAGVCTAAIAASVGVIGGWVPGDSITLDAIGSGVAASAVLGVVTTQLIGTPTIAVAGAFTGTTGNYNVQGTSGTGTKFYVSCTLTNGSGITAIQGIVNAGSYSVNPTNLASEPVVYAGLTGASLGGLKMGIGSLSVTNGGAYAPTTSAQITAIQATSAPLSTTGSGSLSGVTIAPIFGGVATQITAANASRKSLFFQNLSSSNIGYSFFSTAPVIGIPGTETLVPNGSLSENSFYLPNQALWAVGPAFAAYSGREI